MTGGVHCPEATGLDWGSIDSGTLTVPSSADLVSSTTADLDPAQGYVLSTNAPGTYALRLSTGAGPYHGLSVLRTGLYLWQCNMGMSTFNALAHGDFRAAIEPVVPSNGLQVTAFGQSPIPYGNMGTQGTPIDNAPQAWDLYLTIMVNYNSTVLLPSEPFTFLVRQESGFDAQGLPAVMMTRIADAIPGGIV